MALLRIPCSAFRPITMNNVGGPTTDSQRQQHKIDVLIEENSKHWINVSFIDFLLIYILLLIDFKIFKR